MLLIAFIFLVLVARFDFSWGDPDYHQETLENLKAAVKITKKLCAVCCSYGHLDCLLKFTIYVDSVRMGNTPLKGRYPCFIWKKILYCFIAQLLVWLSGAKMCVFVRLFSSTVI